MSNATSIMTPYTNIGGEASRYGGKNRTLKQWYEGKIHQGNARHLGYALNKRDIGVNGNEIYSQFSMANPDDLFDGARSQQMRQSQHEQEVLDRLKKNEFLPDVTFEKYLGKKMNRGKRTLFVNKQPNENAREYMKEYLQQTQAK